LAGDGPEVKNGDFAPLAVAMPSVDMMRREEPQVALAEWEFLAGVEHYAAMALQGEVELPVQPRVRHDGPAGKVTRTNAQVSKHAFGGYKAVTGAVKKAAISKGAEGYGVTPFFRACTGTEGRVQNAGRARA
jgi:hypothetical protein